MKKEDIIEIIENLKNTYPDATCSLDFKTPFELGIAVMLSAQCTDERVNKITPLLFAKYKKPEDYINTSLEEIEEIIKPCGFYKNKAKNVLGYAKMIVEEYTGKMPETMAELVKLPGIGRQSANVIMLEAFNNPEGIAVDTHAKRIANRIGLSKEKEPLKIEQDLIKIIPKKYFKDVNHLLVWHGRNICNARKPQCEKCPIKKYCEFYMKK
ncbi:MAG: endonuclease III [Clostridia bacterium]|nr:endonuclease III [Clostridia bacterium]